MAGAAGHPAITVNISGSNLEVGGGINISGYQGNETAFELRWKVLSWLLEVASVNHHAIQSETYAKLAPNTASWILHEPTFAAWLSRECKTFWGTGIPGAGKTVLTSYVINHIQERLDGTNGIIIFAYCRFSDALSIPKLLGALLGQLSERFMPVLSYIREKLYTPCMERKVEPSEDSLVNAIRFAIHLVSTEIFIAIDALDELRDDVCERLVDILLSLEQSTFLTSRELSLSHLHAPNIYLRAPAEDFSNFVVHKAKRLPKLWSILESRRDVLSELIEKITSKSDGMFLLAALQLSSLGGVTTVKSLRNAIGTLPTQLTDMYKLTLDRIMNQSKEEYTLACRAILWVAHAARPLRVVELLEALAVESDSTELDPDALTNVKALISVCCGLLMIEKKTGTVRLIHYTTHDFFSSYREGPFHRPHHFAATICAVYWHLSGASHHASSIYKELEVLGYLSGSTHYMVSVYRELEDFGRIHPFVDYACRYLGHHTLLSTTEGDHEIPQRVYDLLSEDQHVPLSHVNMDTEPYNGIDYGKAIHFAALHGLLSIVKTSIDAVNERSQSQNTPLIYAAIGGHADIVDLLLGSTEADVNAVNDNKETCLHLASMRGHAAIVQLLLKSPNINVNTKDWFTYTALHYASWAGHEQIVRFLLQFPWIDVHIQDHLRQTAYHLASRNNHQSIVNLLSHASGQP